MRKPNPFSARWVDDPATYFACPGCGWKLAALEGSAADRPSDRPEDRLPDPAGLIELRLQPLLEATPPGRREEVLERALREAAEEFGPGLRLEIEDRSAEASLTLEFNLQWRGRTWLRLGLVGGRVEIRG